MNKTGQGALEYLLLIGVAVLMAAVVLTLMTGLDGATQSSEDFCIENNFHGSYRVDGMTLCYSSNINNELVSNEIVYVDGITIKDRANEPTHPDVKDVMENINKYYITSFNRDSKKGKRYLELHSEYVL